jgi:hypothetical protein
LEVGAAAASSCNKHKESFIEAETLSVYTSFLTPFPPFT